MRGKIIKGIAGFYYVHTLDNLVYECKAKGIFRNKKVKPLVGDDVIFEVIDEVEKKGNITDILPRQNELIRPAVSNIDQALVVFALAEPKPNLNLLDRFLMTMKKQHVRTIVCFNKQDIVSKEECDKLRIAYNLCGCEVVFISALHEEGILTVKQLLKDKTTVFAGPSGVGKSTLLNLVIPSANMETGSVSEKIKRGKHTTRHSELFHMEGNTYIMDTPGFSSLYINDFNKEELKSFFFEFEQYENECKFSGCAHISEPNCGVKPRIETGEISKIRYENYLLLYKELQEQRRY